MIMEGLSIDMLSGIMVGGILVFYGCGYSYYPPINTDANDILLRDNIFIHVMIILLVGISDMVDESYTKEC